MQNQQFSPSQFQEDFSEEETIDLRHYWRVLMRFKWGILGLGILSAVITALVLMQTKNVYQSSKTQDGEAEDKPAVDLANVFSKFSNLKSGEEN